MIAAGATNGMSPCRLTTTSQRAVRIELAQRRQHPVGAGGQVRVGQHRAAAGGPHRPDDLRRRRPPPRPSPTPARLGLAQHPHDHRRAADVGQRLAGQAAGRHAGGNDHDRVMRRGLVGAAARRRQVSCAAGRGDLAGCASGGSVQETPTQQGAGLADFPMADSLTFNKIAGAVLATGLVIFGLRTLTSIVFEQAPPAKPGYAIAIAEDTSGGGDAADVIPDWGTVLPKADIADGQAITAKCASCHHVRSGRHANSIGPGLYGVVGRPPGTHAGYAYDRRCRTSPRAHRLDLRPALPVPEGAAGLHAGHQDDLRRPDGPAGPHQRDRLPALQRLAQLPDPGAQAGGARRGGATQRRTRPPRPTPRPRTRAAAAPRKTAQADRRAATRRPRTESPAFCRPHGKH